MLEKSFNKNNIDFDLIPDIVVKLNPYVNKAALSRAEKEKEQEGIKNLLSKITRLEENIASSTKRIVELSAELQQKTDFIRDLESQMGDNNKKIIAESDAYKLELKNARDAIIEEKEELETKLKNEHQTAIVEKDAKIKELEELMLQLESQMVDIAKSDGSLNARLQNANNTIQSLESELKIVQNAKKQIVADHDKLKQEIENHKNSIRALLENKKDYNYTSLSEDITKLQTLLTADKKQNPIKENDDDDIIPEKSSGGKSRLIYFG
jgi:chromosome segregation ATPase